MTTTPEGLRPRSALLLCSLLSMSAGPACKLFKKTHPSGHLARTASPEQYSERYPDQTTSEWTEAMDPARMSGSHSFGARDTGTLHVWLRYSCTSRDGSFRFTGRVGFERVGLPPVGPVPVSATAEGATLEGIPRSESAPIVVNAPRPSRGSEPGMETDGYVYLFDVAVPQQTTVTFTGGMYAEQGARCFQNFEVWRD